MIFKLLFTPLLVFVSLACQNIEGELVRKAIKGKVIGVTDGDTIDILFEGKPLTIRFEHIDCPEMHNGQPYGKAAKQLTNDLCFGQMVTVLHNDNYDRNKRLIGVVINEKGHNVNKKLVEAGLAWHFKRYSSDSDYAALEIMARRSRVNIWSDTNPVAPWTWRKTKKS